MAYTILDYLVLMRDGAGVWAGRGSKRNSEKEVANAITVFHRFHITTVLLKSYMSFAPPCHRGGDVVSVVTSLTTVSAFFQDAPYVERGLYVQNARAMYACTCTPK